MDNQNFVFCPPLCWAETTASTNLTSDSSSEQSGKSQANTPAKENKLTAITVDKISDEQVTVKLSTLLSPRYGSILIPPAKDKNIWYFAINIIEAKLEVLPLSSSDSPQIFEKPLAHSQDEDRGSSLLKRIRATQFKYNPPIARVVFHLTAPLTPNITVIEDGLLVVFQKAKEGQSKPAIQKDLPPPENTKNISKLTAVNVDISDEYISIAFVVGHNPTYKSGLLPDKEKSRFYFYLNLQNTQSFVAGGKLFKQEIKDNNLTRVMVSQYKREPPMTRIVFYLNKFVKPQISFRAREQTKFVSTAKAELRQKPGNADTDISLKTTPALMGTKRKIVSELVVKFPRAEGKMAGGQKDESAKEQESKGTTTPSPPDSYPKRAASKLTEIKIDDKTLNHITIQLILNGIPDYRTVLMPVDRTKTVGAVTSYFYINFLNTTVERDKIFKKDISVKPLKSVRAVQYRKNPPVARVIFDISDAIKPDIEEKGYQLIVKFPKTERERVPVKTVAQTKTQDTQQDANTETLPFSPSDGGGQKHPLPEPPVTVDETPPRPDDMNATRSGVGGQRPNTNAQKPDSTSVQSESEEQSDSARSEAETPSSFSPTKKQLATITNITAEVLPEETALNIDIEGEIKLLQATYVVRNEAEEQSGGSEKLASPLRETVFSLKLENTITKTLQQINLNEGVIRNVILSPSEGDEKNMEVLVRLSEKVPHSVNSTDVSSQSIVQQRDEATIRRRLVVKFENPPLERLVSLKFDKENLSTVMLILSQQYGANIIAGSDVTGQVSIHATKVPLKEALLQILQAEGYTYIQEPGGFLRVLKDEGNEKAVTTQEPKLRRRVIELKYALATELEESLQKIFLGEKSNIVAEKRTNSLIVTDTEDSLAELEEIIAQLDKEASSVSTERTLSAKEGNSETQDKEAKPPLIKRILRLSYISPDEASAYVQPLLSENGSLLIIDGGHTGAASTGISARGGASTTGSSFQNSGQNGTDSQSGSLALGGTMMVTDTEERLEAVQEIIEQIDVSIPQVEIQAYIVEGTITDQDNLGIDWRVIADQGGSELNASLPFGGDFPALNLQIGNLSVDDFIGVLKILSAHTDTKVLSSPKIMTIGNRPATFTSGDQIPYTELSITQDTDTIATTSFKDTGIILHVTAMVKRDNRVSLTVNTEVSDVAGFTPAGQPRISQRKATTQVLVKDGDTAVIGGLIMERADETVSKVPILGDIPLLGRLFRTTNKKNVKSEVTIFITPRIVK